MNGTKPANHPSQRRPVERPSREAAAATARQSNPHTITCGQAALSSNQPAPIESSVVEVRSGRDAVPSASIDGDVVDMTDVEGALVVAGVVGVAGAAMGAIAWASVGIVVFGTDSACAGGAPVTGDDALTSSSAVTTRRLRAEYFGWHVVSVRR